jgi:hypothetical protein
VRADHATRPRAPYDYFTTAAAGGLCHARPAWSAKRKRLIIYTTAPDEHQISDAAGIERDAHRVVQVVAHEVPGADHLAHVPVEAAQRVATGAHPVDEDAIERELLGSEIEGASRWSAPGFRRSHLQTA